MERLLGKGALDVFITPILMKKSRPAHMFSVLCKQEDKDKLEEEFFLNSTTYGIRNITYERTILDRELESINIDGIEFQIKNGYYNGKKIHSKIEYESIKKACEELGKNYNEIKQKINKIIE